MNYLNTTTLNSQKRVVGRNKLEELKKTVRGE